MIIICQAVQYNPMSQARYNLVRLNISVAISYDKVVIDQPEMESKLRHKLIDKREVNSQTWHKAWNQIWTQGGSDWPQIREIRDFFRTGDPKCTEIWPEKSRICPIWGKSDPLWSQPNRTPLSDKYNVLELQLRVSKRVILIPNGTNLGLFRSNLIPNQTSLYTNTSHSFKHSFFYFIWSWK